MNSQLSIKLEKVKSLLCSFEFTNMLIKRKSKIMLNVQIYLVVVSIQFLYLRPEELKEELTAAQEPGVLSWSPNKLIAFAETNK